MAGETESPQIEPAVDEIKLKGSLSGTFIDAANRLSSLQMYSIKATATELTMVRVESRNMQKKPFLFMIFKFLPDSVEIYYSIASDISQAKAIDTSAKTRKLSVLKNFTSVLSLISDIYKVDNSEMLQHIDSAIDDVLTSLQPNYAQLMSSYESLYSKYIQLKKLNISLSNSNKNLSTQATILSTENTDIKARLEQLESYSDTSLMALVEEWLEAHDGTIDINEFAKTYRLTPSRVDQILNKMVSLGYIEIRG
jgi:hypothetical protein